MDFKAAVLHKPGEELSIESVQLKGLGTTEVLIQVKLLDCVTPIWKSLMVSSIGPFLLFWDTKAPEKLLRSVLK